MIQACDRARFALEPRTESDVAGEVARQQLDRDDTFEPRVARAIDLAHAADAVQRENLVRTKPGAGC